MIKIIQIILLSLLFYSCSSIDSTIKSIGSTPSEKPENLFDFREDSPSVKNEQVFCDKGNSCLQGQCLSRGDGLMVCVQSGANGQSCRKAKDCTGGVCSNRGDGVHVCMGSGKEGDLCTQDQMCLSGNCQKIGESLKFCIKS